MTLYNKRTNWEHFRVLIEETLNTKIPLKTEENINNAIEHLNHSIQQATWNSTPYNGSNDKEYSCSPLIRNKIAQKRKLRKQWQITRSPVFKTKLNKAVKEIREMISKEKEQAIENYLKNLGSTEATDYSLWKATKKLKHPQLSNPPIRMESGRWAKSNADKAKLFADHLEKVFTPNLRETQPEEEEEINQYLNISQRVKSPIGKIKKKGVKGNILKDLNHRKSPGYDLITGKVLKELPDIGYKFLTQLYNAILTTSFFKLLK